MEKIGVGVITYNRPVFVKRLVESILPDWYDELVIVNDGDSIDGLDQYEIIQNPTNLGVCKSKNIAFRRLIENNDYIFIIEDDMLLKGNVFEQYIKAYKRTGIEHFMFAYHGPANKKNISGGKPSPIKIIDYGDVQISLNRHCVGALCFYTKRSIEDVGLFDEEFDRNNFEHVEHSYRLAKSGYSTPYWWWADLADSYNYIEEQACSQVNTSIRRGDTWRDDIRYSALLFKKKHGYMPAWDNHVPLKPLVEVIKILKDLKNGIR